MNKVDAMKEPNFSSFAKNIRARSKLAATRASSRFTLEPYKVVESPPHFEDIQFSNPEEQSEKVELFICNENLELKSY